MQNNFNKIAPVYDFLTRIVFGNSLKNSQRWLLPFVKSGSKVLIIGGGTGWILEDFLEQTRCSNILYLEASEKMIELSRKRFEKKGMVANCLVEFRLGDQYAIKSNEKFNVIFTGFLLDLFKPDPLANLIATLHSTLMPNGFWLVADFLPENSINTAEKLLQRLMVVFFKITANLQADSIPDINKALQKSGLLPISEKHFYRKIIFATVFKKQ